MDASVIETRVRCAEADRVGRAHPTHHLTWCAAVLLAGIAAVAAGCAAGSSRASLADPAAVAGTLRAGSTPAGPWRLRLAWEYADPRGPVEGDGVLRYTAPDSLRLDLFGPGDASMSVALTDGRLRSVGQIRDVRLPPPAFLYAAAGLFRPGPGGPDRGWREDGARVLLYRRGGSELTFRLEGERLVRVEERRDGRAVRRLHLRWSDTADARSWPRSAEFRDRSRESRARWTVRRVRMADTPFSPDIYDLPITSR